MKLGAYSWGDAVDGCGWGERRSVGIGREWHELLISVDRGSSVASHRDILGRIAGELHTILRDIVRRGVRRQRVGRR